MSRKISETNAPIYTNTRVPPAEDRTQGSSTRTETESQIADEAIAVTRVVSAASQ
jgi:hypothetical protein